jgi:hypothetical protein
MPIFKCQIGVINSEGIFQVKDEVYCAAEGESQVRGVFNSWLFHGECIRNIEEVDRFPESIKPK